MQQQLTTGTASICRPQTALLELCAPQEKTQCCSWEIKYRRGTKYNVISRELFAEHSVLMNWERPGVASLDYGEEAPRMAKCFSY